MKIPRDIEGKDLVKALKSLGYVTVRQVGSHIRLSTTQSGTHHVTVPAHKPLKSGTLIRGILKPVATHHGITVADLIKKLNL